MINTFHIGDVRKILKTLPKGRIQTCVTSPPYWGLRDYGTEPQIWDCEKDCDHDWGEKLPDPHKTGLHVGGATGSDTSGARDRENISAGQFCSKCGAWKGSFGLEPTPELYVKHIVEIFQLVRDVLRDDGTLWLNIGDSYVSNPGDRYKVGGIEGKASAGKKESTSCMSMNKHNLGLKPKDLVGIPWRAAFALQADGWYLRSDIIWHKPNPMPESVRDRPTKSHEYIFLFGKSHRYFYDVDAIREEPNQKNVGKTIGLAPKRNGTLRNDGGNSFKVDGLVGRNKRSVWTIPTAPYKGAHFATFPPKLIEPCILAGTSEKGCCSKCGNPWERVTKVVGNQVTEAMRIAGCDKDGKYYGEDQKDYDASLAQKPSEAKKRILESMSQIKEYSWVPTCSCDAQIVPCIVLDPFMGSGTVAVVSERNNRNWVGIELNEEYVELAKNRLRNDEKPKMEKPKMEKQEIEMEKGFGLI